MSNPEFDPDRFLLERLGAEHQNGTWVGKELLPIANAVRQLGGDDEDYERWVKASHLWTSYIHSTSDRVTDQERSLESAWRRSIRARPFDLDEALHDLEDRVRRHTRWPNPRTASRDRAVALAFIRFCIDRNCYTRTISSYELAKYTPGMSQRSVHRALMALLDLRLLQDVDRGDRRPSTRSTRRYRLNLYWQVSLHTAPTPRALQVPSPSSSGLQDPLPVNGATDLRSTCKSTLSQERRSGVENRDLWSRKGLGPGAFRVWEAVGDEPLTAKEISARTGQSERSVRAFASKLADACLAGIKPGRPKLYFRVDTPLEVLEDVLGCAGYVDRVRARIEHQQEANRAAWPGTYKRLSDGAA